MVRTEDKGDSSQPNSAPGNRLRPVTPRTVADQVAEQLRYLINSGEFKPGDKIPGERELAVRMAWGVRPCERRCAS
jgi:DNA-binding GntR family transcriptional regulator